MAQSLNKKKKDNQQKHNYFVEMDQIFWNNIVSVRIKESLTQYKITSEAYSHNHYGIFITPQQSNTIVHQNKLIAKNPRPGGRIMK